MLTRILTALFLIPIVIFILINPNPFFLFGAALLSTLFSLKEYYQAANEKVLIPKFFAINWGLCCLVSGFFFGISGIFYCFFLGFLFYSFYEVFGEKVEGATARIALICLGNFYIPSMISFMFFLREEYSPLFLLSLFILTWATDSCAYFFGLQFGKRKLSPLISPKKSVEGFIAGSIGGPLIFTLFYGYFIDPKFNPQVMVFGLLISLVAQLGDLFASLIKRDFGIKDFSNLFPGHGGFLDRMDSLLFVFPSAFYLGKLFKI